MRRRRQAPAAASWYVLIHQLPPRPLYLRAKVRNRLVRVGAIALKNSVYVLPAREECLEDLQWIAQEALAGGGDAFVCEGRFLTGVSHETLVGRFRSQSASAYEALKGEIRRGGRDPAAALPRLRKRLAEVVSTDFFGQPERKEVEAMLRRAENKLHGSRNPRHGGARQRELVGRTWVTRRDPKIDRLATAWLVRRFVDARARFRFIDPKREAKRAQEIGFDMLGGDFTHEGERCTFEALLARLGLSDPPLRPIAEIVHDVDLKDAKFGRSEAAGLQQMIQGLVRAYPDDAQRLEHGCALFDGLYASFGGSLPRAKRSRRRG